MKKRFRTAGACIPEKNYMVDISGRINIIKEFIEHGDYFTINRPRQYGKTTTLNELFKALKNEYVVIYTSFEGAGDDLFSSDESFCSRILGRFAFDTRMTDKESSELLLKYHKKGLKNFDELSNAISDFIQETGKEAALLIDEVDKNSNSKVFLQFLGLLRNKYLARDAGEDITFKTVILAGVHDIKNLKLAIRDENEAGFNSPWNIAIDFNIDMSFPADEICAMLESYSKDIGLSFDTYKISGEINRLTNGYPYLVSRICCLIDEQFDKNWTSAGVEEAAKYILDEKSPLFDDVIKNIDNNSDLKTVVSEMLFEGRRVSYSLDTFEKGIIYGIFTKKNDSLAIHNELFEARLYNFLLEQRHVIEMASPLFSVAKNQFIKDNKLDMERLLLKFQEFMYQEYRKSDEKFYEKHGRLLFLAYIRPIINGGGYYFVEPMTRENKRMDICITYGNEKHIVELKIWYGRQYEQDGVTQLAEYLDIQKQKTGWLLTFGPAAQREKSAAGE